MEIRDMLRQRVLEARCAEATEACYVYEIQDDPDQPIGGHDAVLDLAAAKELESQAATIDRLTSELDEARAVVERLRGDDWTLRMLLAIRVAGAGLYRDDGELQDNTAWPLIDFKRDPASVIRDKIYKRGEAAIAALAVQPASDGEVV